MHSPLDERATPCELGRPVLQRRRMLFGGWEPGESNPQGMFVLLIAYAIGV